MQVTDKGYVQCISTLEEFENGGLFLRLGLLSTLIRHENGAFRKRSSNRWRHDNPVISLIEFSSNRNPKRLVIVAFFNFSGVVWTEKHLLRFQSETCVLKSLQHRVDGSSLDGFSKHPSELIKVVWDLFACTFHKESSYFFTCCLTSVLTSIVIWF